VVQLGLLVGSVGRLFARRQVVEQTWSHERWPPYAFCANFAHVRFFESWEEVGARVAEAREADGLTQGQLAAEAGLERTALAKIERGRRSVSSLELARLAGALRRPIEWFIREAPAAVVSRRSEQIDSRVSSALDIRLELVARDVELLADVGELPRLAARKPSALRSLAQAEQLASEVRKEIGEPEGGLPNLDRVAERLGLYAFAFEFPEETADGAYVALEGVGVAVLNGSMPTGRRRFTLAHEIGHHVLADAHSTDYALLDEITQRREQLINIFAIHLLMPRQSVLQLWRERGGVEDPRGAAICLAAEYRVSWTAACAHLKNLGFIDESTRQRLLAYPPGRADYLERSLFIVEELSPPSLPPGYISAVIKAYRRHKITSGRAVELLYGTLSEDDLPAPHEVPLDALEAELPRGR